ncbi:MAG: di-heme oxidoredictase family protein [Bacteroidota bacterium]
MKQAALSIVAIAIALICSECVPRPDFSAEALGGGANFTTDAEGVQAFGKMGRMDKQAGREFSSGNSLFKRNWVEAPASVTTFDGVGPLLNARSCGSCHSLDGRAAPPDEFEIERAGLLFRLNNGEVGPHGAPAPHPRYGGQIQDVAVSRVKPEAQVVTTYDTVRGAYADGTPYELYRPIYTLTDLAYGEIDPAYKLSPRIAPQLIGMGLLDNIPEAALLAHADPEDGDGDGISGRPNYIWDVAREKKVVGRFGWKANQPTIRQHTASAFNGDMGLTTTLFPEDEFNAYQQARNEPKPDGGHPEVTDKQLDRVTLYVKALSVPRNRNTDTAAYYRGRTLFYDLNCEACHKASFTTGDQDEIAALNGQTFYPYTDLLLHDMGASLADDCPDHEASGREWRTPPLWGVGKISVVNGHTRLLHDGRARGVAQAILWHGGEAEASKEEFVRLSAEERAALIFFINSL